MKRQELLSYFTRWSRFLGPQFRGALYEDRHCSRLTTSVIITALAGLAQLHLSPCLEGPWSASHELPSRNIRDP